MSTAQLEPQHQKPVTGKSVPVETVTAPATVEKPSTVGSEPPGKPKAHWWVWLVVLAVIGVASWGCVHLVHRAQSGAAADNAKQRGLHDLPVVVKPVTRGDMNIYLVGLGSVTPLNTVTLKSRVDGQIMDVGFTEGQMVKKGQYLLQIDDRPYKAALEQAQGQLLKDQAAVASASWNVDQDNAALKDKAIAEQQLHTDTATRDQAKGAVVVDNAAIDNANVNMDYCHITSPIAGRIGLRLVDPGNIVHASDTTGLVVITQLQPITVVFNLPEDNIGEIEKRLGSGLSMEVDAYDRDLTKKLATGKLLAVDNVIDPTTGTVKLKAQFDNDDNILFPSEFVNAKMLVDTVRNAVLVPTAAVQHTPTAAFVYVVKPDNTVTIRNVTTGASQAAVGPDEEDTTVISDGLQPGETVVVDGVDKLQEGTKVQVRSGEGKHGSSTRPTTGPAAAMMSGATTNPSAKAGAGGRGQHSHKKTTEQPPAE